MLLFTQLILDCSMSCGTSPTYQSLVSPSIQWVLGKIRNNIHKGQESFNGSYDQHDHKHTSVRASKQSFTQQYLKNIY